VVWGDRPYRREPGIAKYRATFDGSERQTVTVALRLLQAANSLLLHRRIGDE
jgi:hypothetical protein